MNEKLAMIDLIPENGIDKSVLQVSIFRMAGDFLSELGKNDQDQGLAGLL